MNKLTNLLILSSLAISSPAIGTQKNIETAQKNNSKQELKLEKKVQNASNLLENLQLARYPVWHCTAQSNYATGWGSSPSKITARNIAMNEYRIRTPNFDICYHTGCDYY